VAWAQVLMLAAAVAAPEPSVSDRPHLTTPQGIGTVRAIAWSPDGSRLAVAHDDPSLAGEHALSLMDAGPWRETMRLVDGARASVDGVAVSRDGTIGAGSFNGATRLWDREGRALDVLDCGRGAGERGRGAANGSSGVAFSPDGKSVAALCTDGTLRLWTMAGGHARLARKTALGASFSAMAFAPDGRAVAWGSWDGVVAVTSTVDGKTRRLGQHGKNVIQSIGFDAAGTTLVSSSRDGEVRIWDAAAGTLRRSIKVQSGLSVPAAVSPDGKVVVTGGPAGLSFWDAATGQVLDRRRDTPGDQAVGALAFRPDGTLLAVAGTRGIEIVDVGAARRTVAEIASLGDTGTQSVVFTPRGDRLATGDVDGLRLWNLGEQVPSSVLVERARGAGSALDVLVDAGPHPARLAPAPGAGAVHATDPTGSLAAVCDPQGGLAVLARSGGRLRASDAGPFTALAFSPDGGTIAAAAENGKIETIDATTARKVRELRSSPGADPVASIAVAGKGARVAVGTTRGAIEIWDVAAGQQIRTVPVSPGYPQAIAFSPDGKWMAAGMSQRGTLLFALPDFTPSVRLSAAPGRDATFVESLSTGEVHASGVDAQRFVVCRAGRAVLPAAACSARPR
jgi:WD40 repeat protein